MAEKKMSLELLAETPDTNTCLSKQHANTLLPLHHLKTRIYYLPLKNGEYLKYRYYLHYFPKFLKESA